MVFSSKSEPHSARSLAQQLWEVEEKKDISKILSESLITSTKVPISEILPPPKLEKPEYKRKHILSYRAWDANVDAMNSIAIKIQLLEKTGEDNQIKTEHLFAEIESLSEQISQLSNNNQKLTTELEKIKKQKPWQSELIHWIDSNKILVGIYLIIPGGALEFIKWLIK